MGKKGLLVALAAMVAFSMPGCLGLSETGKYAKQLNLPEETIAIVNQLNYGTNTVALLDEINYLPEEVQINEEFLNYLKQIADDKVVTDDELARFNDFDQDGLTNSDELGYDTNLFNADSDDDGLKDAEEVKYGTNPLEANPGLKQALDYLSTFPEKNSKEMIELGLGNVVVDYLLLLSSLTDQDFAQYASENKLCIQDRDLTKLEIKFLNEPDNYSKDLFDYYMSEVNNINPELASELTKLPDFQEIDIEDIEALEDIVDLARGTSVFDTNFDSILNEGIKDERKYCSPLEALVWLLYDYDKEYIDNEIYYHTDFGYLMARGQKTQLKPLLWRLVYFSWEKSSESNNFLSGRWEDFSEVTDRLNSPMLVSMYMVHNISYDHEKCQAFIKSGRDIWQSPRVTFDRKQGVCKDHATLALYCLLESGYKYDNFELYQNDAACVLFACAQPWSPGKGHLVCLFIRDGVYYIIDNGTLVGPFLIVDKAADATYANWGKYYFVNLAHTKTKQFSR